MTGKNHMATGLLVSAVLITTVPTLSDTYAVPLIAASMAGALIPDIDTPTSKLGRKFPLISIPLSLTAGHRGMIHSPFICGCIAIVMAVLGCFNKPHEMMFYVCVGIIIGFLSHLLGDICSDSGIPLMFPFSKKHFGLHLLHTGSILDWIMTFVLAAAGLYILYKSGITIG